MISDYLQSDRDYQRGLKHGKQGHVFAPPRDIVGRSYYHAGFNIARGVDIFSQCTDTQRSIISRAL